MEKLNKVSFYGYYDWAYGDTSLCCIEPKPKYICHASGRGDRLWELLEPYNDFFNNKKVKITIEIIQ